MSYTGHCVCGNITYEIDADPILVGLCHCDVCQRLSGSAFSINILFPRAALDVRGTPKVVNTTGTDTGENRERHFCGTCGSSLFTMLAEQPDLAIVKAGTLTDKTGFSPTIEVWHDSAQEWVAAMDSGRPTHGRDLAGGNVF